jgi:hypothetical protein
MHQRILTLREIFDAFSAWISMQRVNPIHLLLWMGVLMFAWRFLAMVVRHVRRVVKRPERGRQAIADAPPSSTPILTRKALARLGGLLLEIAEILSGIDGEPGENHASQSEKTTDYDAMMNNIQMMRDKIEHWPGFHAIQFHVNDLNDITIYSSDTTWEPNLRAWLKQVNWNPRVTFLHPMYAPESSQPKSQPKKSPRRCANCKSLQMTPRFPRGSNHSDGYVCMRCGSVFPADPGDAPAEILPLDAPPPGPKTTVSTDSDRLLKSDARKRPDAQRPMPPPLSALEALDRAMQRPAPDVPDSDATAIRSIYSGPTRDPNV